MSALTNIAEDPGRYVSWGVIQISVANLAIIVVMILLFILALVVPFPTSHNDVLSGSGHESDQEGHAR